MVAEGCNKELYLHLKVRLTKATWWKEIAVLVNDTQTFGHYIK